MIMAAPTEETKHRAAVDMKDQIKERKRDSRSVSGEPSSRRSRSRSNGPSRQSHSRSISRSRNEQVRENTSRDCSRSRGRRENDNNSMKQFERSKPSESDKSSRGGQDDDDDNTSLVGRRCKTSSDRKNGYIKSTTVQQRDKERSKGRKSDVMGSLSAFLGEGKSAQSSRASGDRSVVSSVSRMGRRRRQQYTSSSVSVIGGGREEMRTKRRSRSGSVTDRRLRSHSPRTNSGSLHCHKTKQSVGSRHSVSPSPIQNCSKKSELLSSEPILSSSNMTASTTSLSNDEGGLEEKRKRAMQQRRASITGSDGVEVPPGFPVAAVENTAQVVGQENEESDDAKIGSPNLESTAKIRQRQQRRASMGALSSMSTTTQARQRHQRRASMSGGEVSPLNKDQEPESTAKIRQRRQRRASMGALSSKGSTTQGRQRQQRRASTSGGGIQNTQEAKLASLDDDKGSRKHAKKSSGRSVSSVPVRSSKHSSSKRRPSRKTEKETRLEKRESSDLPLESLSELTPSDLKAREHRSDVPTKAQIDESMNSSMASLDPKLLNRPGVGKKMGSMAAIYQEDQGGEQQQTLNELSIPQSIGIGASPGKFNQSTISFDSVQLQQVAIAMGMGDSDPSENSSPSTPGTPGCLRRKIGQAFESPRRDKRVSWVELPLHNPQDLLVKSTNRDGTNEIITTALADRVPANGLKQGGIDINDDSKAFSPSQPTVDPEKHAGIAGINQMKSNLSLDTAFSRPENCRSSNHAADEQTVGTTNTLSTANTNTSEQTMKTTNASVIGASTKVCSSSDRVNSTHKASDNLQDSMATEEIINDGSSSKGGSSSSQNRRSRKDESSDGSLNTPPKKGKKDGETREKRSSQRPSKAHDSTKSTSRNRGSRNGGGARESRRRDDKGSGSREMRQRGESGDDRDEKVGSVREHQHKNSRSEAQNDAAAKKAGTKNKYKPSGKKEGRASGEPTEEVDKDRPQLVQHNSIGSDDGSKSRRRKSYLPRKSKKSEKEKSRELRASVNASLDTFLQKMGDNAPVTRGIKDDNRSVFSDLRDADHRRRLRHLRKGEKFSRRISRSGSEPSNNIDGDDMSVVSLSVISSKQAQQYLEDSNRPVINLKQTNFSRKLSKLHVAF